MPDDPKDTPSPAFAAAVEAIKEPLAEWEGTLLGHHFRAMTDAGDPYALTRIIEMALRRRVEIARAALLRALTGGEG